MADPAKTAVAPTLPAPTFSNASLYVGDLASDVGEGNLFDIFNRVGAVSSIRVCRDTATRRSLGYAYVNFHNPQDAERALETLNNTLIRGKVCRIMWSQRDPSLRKSGVGNIFIKNLHPSIDHATLKETFSLYGNIISCKVATDETNNSKGYGFVHFETQEMAEKAIEKLNGMSLEGQTLQVAHFIPRRERQTKDKEQFTNVFVKNLDENIDNEKLKQIFERFGPSTSATLAYDAETNVSKCFGFVNFERHEDAKRAIEELNGKPLSEGGKELYVGRAQKRSERDAELRAKQSQRVEKYAGVNLYIKNLDDDIDDDRLRTEFGQFGSVQSAKVMKDDKTNSKGFGFVSLATPEEANRAVNEMNGKIISAKPLYVALAQKKEQRKAQLEAQFRNKAQMKLYSGATPPVFYAPPQAQGFVYPAQMMPRNTGYRAERWAVPNPPLTQYQPVNFMVPGRPPRQHMPRTNPANRRFNQRGGGAGGSGAPREQSQVQSTGPQSQPQQSQQQLAQQGSQQSPGTVPNEVLPEFTVEYLAQIPVAEQSAAIGERLFTLITRINPEYAGKITGMLLESFKPEVPEETLLIINNPQVLNDKVNEAMRVLQQHAQSQGVEVSTK